MRWSLTSSPTHSLTHSVPHPPHSPTHSFHSPTFTHSLTQISQSGCLHSYSHLQASLLAQAAYHGVPVVGLPLFAEQPDNMARAVEQGFGLSVDVNDATGLSQNLRRALHHVLGNPSFAANASRVSGLIRSTHWSPAGQAASEFALHFGFASNLLVGPCLFPVCL